MSNANIGWLFYKDYYNDLNYIDLVNGIEENNSVIVQQKIENIINSTPKLNEPEIIGSTRFQATTTYPGLILGSGNTHEIPDVKGQAILGFHFDYTSGLPTIQGSSIKGVLRSAFKYPEYINEYINIEEDISKLEKEIFDNGDIFFDAEIIKADSSDKILGDDYITPHNNPLKDPIPLRFIKILPNVTFLFQFELSDGIITKEQKEWLFRKILTDLGLGAKTNVGYGKLKITNTPKTKEEIEAQKEAQAEAEKKKKEQEELKKQQQQEEKEKKKQEGLNALLDCKTLAEGFKLLKDSFGKKPKPTNKEKEIIQKFYQTISKKHKISKGDIKTFKKYGIL